MDIAMLLFDVLVVSNQPDRQQFGQRFLTNVLRGYIPSMPDSAFWVKQLPLFLKLLEISLFITLYRGDDAFRRMIAGWESFCAAEKIGS